MVEGLAVEAVGAHGAQAVAGKPAADAGPSLDLMAAPHAAPSAAQASDFARAALDGPVRETSASLPPVSGGWASRVLHQVETLTGHLAMPGATASPAAAAPAGAEPGAVASGRDAMSAAVSQMERAYMFAIETTMASRGSTESTKIFNTLLKGQ